MAGRIGAVFNGIDEDGKRVAVPAVRVAALIFDRDLWRMHALTCEGCSAGKPCREGRRRSGGWREYEAAEFDIADFVEQVTDEYERLSVANEAERFGSPEDDQEVTHGAQQN